MNEASVQWPSAADYVAAVQDPERCLIDPRLVTAEFTTNMMGLPKVSSGQVAAVFPVTIDGRKAALRLFTAPTDQAERYARISDFLAQHPNAHLVDSTWIPEAVAFGTGRFPAVLMPWIEGRTMASFIDDTIEDDRPIQVRYLADRWIVAALSLIGSGAVHGDIQHGNVMVSEDLGITLIDYDSMWVPGLQSELAEVGHPNYQHPERLEDGHVTPTLDVFPSYLIYLSLRAIASDPSLWDKFYNGENLLFVQSDLTAVGRQGASIWDALSENPDAEVVQMSRTLAELCQVKLASVPQLSTLLESGLASVDRSQRYVTERAGRASAGNWWSDGGVDQDDEVAVPGEWQPDDPDGLFGSPGVGPSAAVGSMQSAPPASAAGDPFGAGAIGNRGGSAGGSIAHGTARSAGSPAPYDDGHDRARTIRMVAIVVILVSLVVALVATLFILGAG